MNQATTTAAAGNTSGETAKTTETAAGAGTSPAQTSEGTGESQQSNQAATGGNAASESQNNQARTFSQAEVDNIVKGRLEKAQKTAETLAQKAKDEAEAAAAIEQGKFKELWEKAEKKATDAEAKADKAERDALKERIGHANSLPPELTALLQGEDEAALDAHAKTLAALVKAPVKAPGSEAQRSGGSAAIMGDDEMAELARMMNLKVPS